MSSTGTDVALRFGARDDGTLAAQMRRVNRDLDTFESNAKKTASSVASSFSAIGAGVAAISLGKLTSELVDFADALVATSKQTGIALSNLQELQFISVQADVSVDSLTGGIARLQRALEQADDGQKAAVDSLKDLGIVASDFFNLQPDQQFIKVALAIDALPSASQRTAAAMDLFGRSGAELLPLMHSIAQESGEIENRFTELGGPVGDDVLKQLDDLGDEASAAALAVKSLGAELLGLVAENLRKDLHDLTSGIGALRHAAFGGNNEQVNISDRLVQLQNFIKLADESKFGAGAEQIRKWQQEIDELTLKYEKFTRVVAIDQPDIKFPDPLAGGSLQFEETDAQAAARKKAADDIINFHAKRNEEILRLTEQRVDREMALERKGDEARLKESIDREAKWAQQKIDIHVGLETFLDQVRGVFNIKQIDLEEIKNQSILELAGGLFRDLAGANTKFAKLQQNIAIAQTVWYTAVGIMNAFRTLPWPANLAAAAKVALTGAIQVAKIKATNYTGGGSAPTVSGGTSLGSLEQQQANTAAPSDDSSRGGTTVYIQGVVTDEVLDQLFAGLREGFNRDVVIIPQNSLQATMLRGAA